MWHVTLCPIRLQEGKMKKKKRKLWNSRSDSVGVWESCLLSIFVPISSNQENERLVAFPFISFFQMYSN